MQYLVLLYDDEKRWAQLNEEEVQAEIAEYGALSESDGKLIQGGNALQPTSTATTVRVREGKRLVTDGPFAETREQLGGYYLIEAANLDEALAFAAKIPATRYGCAEVRPIMNVT
ncbi:MAG: YciI family protein [Myxococcales bacterium]|nr:YciI family protein [Myxococcales bacterium]